MKRRNFVKGIGLTLSTFFLPKLITKAAGKIAFSDVFVVYPDNRNEFLLNLNNQFSKELYAKLKADGKIINYSDQLVKKYMYADCYDVTLPLKDFYDISEISKYFDQIHEKINTKFDKLVEMYWDTRTISFMRYSNSTKLVLSVCINEFKS